MPLRSIVAVTLLLFAGFARAADDGLALFTNHVRPILVDHCLKCHGGEKTEGDLDLSDPRRAAQGRRARPGRRPRRGEESRLYRLVAHPKSRTCPTRRRSSPRRPSRRSPPGSTPGPRTTGRWSSKDRPWTEQARSSPTRTGSSGRSGRSAASAPPPVKDEGLGRRTRSTAFILAKLEEKGPRRRTRRPTNAHADPPGVLRPDRPAADAGGGRRVPRRRLARRLRRLVDRLLASPALRRALGPALARPGPLRREPRLRARLRPAHRLPLPRLRHQGAQPRTCRTTTFVRWQIAGDELAPNDPLALMATGLPRGRRRTARRSPRTRSRRTATTNWTTCSARSARRCSA